MSQGPIWAVLGGTESEFRTVERRPGVKYVHVRRVGDMRGYRFDGIVDIGGEELSGQILLHTKPNFELIARHPLKLVTFTLKEEE